jgi:hypothetical protein
MKTKIVLIFVLACVCAGVCIAQSFRRNFEFPSVSNQSQGDDTVNTDAIVDKAVTLAKMLDGENTGDMLWWTGSVWDFFDANEPGEILYINDSNQPRWNKSPVVASGGGPSLGGGKGKVKLNDLATDVAEIELAILELQQQADDTAIVNGTVIGSLQFYGDDDTASADAVAASIVATSTGTWTDGAEDGRLEFSVADNGVLNDDQLVLATDGTVTTSANFIPTDLEIPQASPAAPGVDGGVEIDFTDGTLVVQHGSAHTELGASTDIVVGKLIKSFSATFAMPDSLQSEIDNWPLKGIESTEFPHGIVVTAIHLKTSASSTYAVNVENWDDPTTINAANGTIDAITTSAGTEVTETTITYSTIAAGQIIMLDLPATDIGWFTITVEYYEPIA